MSDELIKRVSTALLAELRESGALVGESSVRTGLPLVEGFIELDKLAKAALAEMIAYQTAEVIEQMKAGRAMPDEPGHPDLGPPCPPNGYPMMGDNDPPLPPLGKPYDLTEQLASTAESVARTRRIVASIRKRMEEHDSDRD